MMVHLRPQTLAAGLFIIATLLQGCSSAPRREADGQCSDIARSGHLNVLTLSLLYSETRTLDQRLANLAEFVANNDVDVIVLQEVVGGGSAGKGDSAASLRTILARTHNLDYNLSSVLEAGKYDELAVENAVLSPCEMPSLLAKRLPRAPQVTFQGQTIRLGHNILTVRLNVPGFGPIRIYNAHLCDACSVDDRATQLDEALDFIEDLQAFIADDTPVVLGGDFELDRFRNSGAEEFLYNSIIAAGFVDAHAQANGHPDSLCPSPPNADAHCTVGVSSLSGPGARRVDYVFFHGFAAVLDSRVVFNTDVTGEPTVSDHAGVFSRLELPR
jgi:maltose 6'-phosphate phosphatase